MLASEYVVLCDDDARPLGTVAKADVHTTDTPLHLAFSAYLLDDAGRLLLTRRALTKVTWPGVWTNSFCGHPGPGEATPDAVIRRADQELGITATDIIQVREVLPDFRYRAVDSSGIVENEICPVYVVRLAPEARIEPAPAEVDQAAWADPRAVCATVDGLPQVFSPWMVSELADARLRAALSLGLALKR